MGKTAFLYDPIYLEHDTGFGHPERIERVAAINKRVNALPFFKEIVPVKMRKADYKYIEMIHDRTYIDRVKKEIESGIQYLDSMDTAVSSRSFEAALCAAGGCLSMCDAIMKGEADTGFCAIRPPGHHAERNYAAGFCIFNNIAIAARYLQSEHGIKKIAIIDWDVHHGNGTQHSFEDDPSILYVSLHQYPHYPGTGASEEKGFGAGKGFTLNIPMRAGSGDREYLEKFNDVIIPELEIFKPDFILISAGFDAHEADPLSSIQLSSEMYYKFTKLLQSVAEKYSKKRIMAVLEGGYDLTALAEGVEKVITAFHEG